MVVFVDASYRNKQNKKCTKIVFIEKKKGKHVAYKNVLQVVSTFFYIYKKTTNAFSK